MGDASYVIDIKIIEIDIKCPTNNLEREQMKDIPYASIVGNLMYAQEDISIIQILTTKELQRKS
ncbi:hypothetical protein KY290_010174 [Solanum tuberosum]|uniref:CheW-like domain-containing protein n=1 Tax=Solanum tuberosum TaxID=4113 RepID=A0ABQ7VX24_SOLTU|nr:hypothetical protein KY289_010560 [Solanum tuberosum]KAH0773037.1 hypothetical protein KY290_010174 [Solanum tuberosum]